MWVVGAFMALNIDYYGVEKYYVKWLRVLWLCETTWVQVLGMPIVCIWFIIIFDNILEHVEW